MHHDLKKLPNGNYLSLDRKDRTITNFPINFFDSNIIEDAEVIDDVVIEIDPSGRIINEWSMMDLLDPRRIGFLSLKKIAGSYDWGHANSISYDSEQNSILVSLRAQDAVVSFNKTLGTLNWILGNHDNWDESIREYLLNPVGGVEWPFGQHDIQPLGNNRYSLFDNGNYRVTPFNSELLEVPDEKTFSRSIIYQIDPLAKTISTVSEYRPDPVLFSRAVGSTQLLPDSRNILSNFGVLTEMPDSNIKSAKIIETNGTHLSEVVSTISVSNSSSNWGVRVYRAWKLPIDYQATATVHSTPKVEIYLLDPLDDSRNFCIDIVGSKANANSQRGLQAHTCYSYQGEISVDQGFDKNLIKENVFFMPSFDVCMTSNSSDSNLALSFCNGSESQKFRFLTNGNIVVNSNPNLCITVAQNEAREGGGGNPIHLIRELKIEECRESLSIYQSWGTRSSDL